MKDSPPLLKCSKCHVDKAPSDFYKSKNRRPYGLSSRCKLCERQRLDNIPPTSRERQVESWRKRNLKKKFGITTAEYDEMHARQSGLCLICEQPETDVHHKTGQPQRLAVDHDPATGVIRGLLCARCNKGIGSLMHDVKILKAAIVYLETQAEVVGT